VGKGDNKIRCGVTTDFISKNLLIIIGHTCPNNFRTFSGRRNPPSAEPGAQTQLPALRNADPSDQWDARTRALVEGRLLAFNGGRVTSDLRRLPLLGGAWNRSLATLPQSILNPLDRLNVGRKSAACMTVMSPRNEAVAWNHRSVRGVRCPGRHTMWSRFPLFRVAVPSFGVKDIAAHAPERVYRNFKKKYFIIPPKLRSHPFYIVIFSE
jgi:hypothetical protein